ncbi:MAG: GGDEF domain-containing protein [Gammaproteobacteria bacterium]
MKNIKDIEVTLKKVFKIEFADLERFSKISQERDLSREELFQEYDKLLESYRSLLIDAAKITKIGDINQKKLYKSHTNIEKASAFHYRSSITDQLTQLYNRGHLMNILDKEFAISSRYRTPLSCILGDIDDFKSINDNFGHLSGDAVLKKVAETLKTNIRETDVVGRYGGEEFLIILPNIRSAEALLVAEKVRSKIAQTKVENHTDNLFVTISFGLADTLTYSPKTVDELLHNVDKALYSAKEHGKNRCVIFQGQPASQ